MINPVIIKGNNMGIRLIMSPDASIEMITLDLKKKLHATKHYYKNIRPIKLTFEGKTLTEDEIIKITNVFSNYGLNIKTNETIPDNSPIRIDNSQLDKDGLFLIGTIRNGQSIDATKSIVILGDIEHGAIVNSEGNIIVVGHIYGSAISGCNGNKGCFVYSLDKSNRISGGIIKHE